MNPLAFLYIVGAYNCGAYGAGNFNEGTCEAQAAGGALAYTGEPWFIMLVLSVVIIGLSVGLFFWKKSKKSK